MECKLQGSAFQCVGECTHEGLGSGTIPGTSAITTQSIKQQPSNGTGLKGAINKSMQTLEQRVEEFFENVNLIVNDDSISTVEADRRKADLLKSFAEELVRDLVPDTAIPTQMDVTATMAYNDCIGEILKRASEIGLNLNDK